MKSSRSWIALLGVAAVLVVLPLLLAPDAKERAPVLAPDFAPADAERRFDLVASPAASLPSPHASHEPAALPLPDAPPPEPTVEVRVRAAFTSPLGFPGSPLPAAERRIEVGVCIRRNQLGETLLELVTDAEGTARGSLPWSALARPEGARLEIWAHGEGDVVLEGRNFVSAPKEPGGSVEVQLRLQRGTVIEGLLLGPDGLPAAGRVTPWTLGERGPLSSSETFAGADGRFRVKTYSEGQTWIHGKGRDTEGSAGESAHLSRGTGFSEPFDVRFLEPTPWVEVRVSGPGVLRGRVLDEHGEPAGGVWLSLVDTSPRTPSALDSEAWTRREGHGHTSVGIQTDARGAFLARGLRQGLWTITAQISKHSIPDQEFLLTPDPIPSDGRALELRLVRPHLLIHVRHADGSLPPEDFQVHWMRSSFRSASGGWPEKPGLLVALALEQVTDSWSAYYFPKDLEPGRFLLEVEAGSIFDVGTLGGDLPWTRQRVHVPEGAGRVDVDVVLPDPAPFGGLLLSVLDADGTRAVGELRIRIIDPASGVAILDKKPRLRKDSEGPLRFRLPAGDSLLRVEGAPDINDHHGTLWRPRTLGAWEGPLHVASGGETEITAILDRPAHLRIRLTGEASDADRDAVRRTVSSPRTVYPREEDKDEYVEYWATRVELSLERPGRWPEPVWFARYAMEGTSAVGTHLFSSLTFGAEETSQALSPGEYQLTARTSGGRILRRPVTLRPGATLEVALVFE